MSTAAFGRGRGPARIRWWRASTLRRGPHSQVGGARVNLEPFHGGAARNACTSRTSSVHGLEERSRRFAVLPRSWRAPRAPDWEPVTGAGLDGLGITPRWYRRIGATVIARGVGHDAAAAFLGRHTSTAVTEGHYVVVDPDGRRCTCACARGDAPARGSDPRLLMTGAGAEEEH